MFGSFRQVFMFCEFEGWKVLSLLNNELKIFLENLALLLSKIHYCVYLKLNAFPFLKSLGSAQKQHRKNFGSQFDRRNVSS